MKTDTDHVWMSYESPFGTLRLTATRRGLDGLIFPGRAPGHDEAGCSTEPFGTAVRELDEYFAGARRCFDLALDLSQGTPFQQQVWRAAQAIPYGQTITYGQLATKIGRLDRVRAVGAALGQNPVPIIVPCHRVIAADGGLTGYLGGLERKRALLEAEHAVRHSAAATVDFAPRQLALL
jgi:methylated-DNA-[protein]-cysteine S-methyltransferase